MRADRLELGGEDPVGGQLPLDRHGGSDVGGPQQDREVAQRQDQHAEHAVGPVDQRQPLLGGQLDRHQPGGSEGLRGRHQHPRGIADVTFSDQRQGTVREGGQVAGAAERAVLADHRGDAGVQDADHQLGHLGSYAGPAGGQRREPQQHQPSYDLALDLGAGTGRVRADQRPLQLGPHLVGDVPGRQRSEAGGDAVGGGGCGGQLLHHCACPGDRRARLLGQSHPVPGASDPHHLREGERPRADVDGNRA